MEIEFQCSRLVGRPEGYKFDTITFYDGEYFMGEQQNLYLDAASLQRDNLGRWVSIQFQIKFLCSI